MLLSLKKRILAVPKELESLPIGSGTRRRLESVLTATYGSDRESVAVIRLN